MGFNAGGRWTPPPYVDSAPPAWWYARATQPPATTDPAAGRNHPAEWGPSSLRGTKTLNIGETKFKIPQSSQVKRLTRSGIAWVKTDDGRVHTLSEAGELVQTDAEMMAVRWDLL